MARLAIKGHPKRGKEVIEILKMLGGDNKYHINITEYNLLYTIREGDDVIIGTYPNNSISQIYTLEEFLEKFPYKVGDKVCFPDDLSTPFTINKMWWDENANELLCSFIEDDIEVPVIGIRAYKEKSIDKTNKVIFEANAQSCDIMEDIIEETNKENGIIYDEIDFNRCPAADKVHLILGNNYEIKEENGNYYVVKKQPKYPKTYEECCEVLGISSYFEPGIRNATAEECHIFTKLIRLKRCRDAYWKIAGEEMGLGKPWNPDWTKANERKYCIVNTEGSITKWVQKTTNKILAFPTGEMRDAFYENFKDLIEECKELL